MELREGASQIDPRVLLRLQALAIAGNAQAGQRNIEARPQLALRQMRAEQAREVTSRLIERIIEGAESADGATEARLLRTSKRCADQQKALDDLRLRYFARVREWRESHLALYEQTVTDSLEDLIRNDTDAVMSLSDADLRGVQLMLAGQCKRVAAEFMGNLGDGVAITPGSDDVNTVLAQLMSTCEPLRAVENVTHLLSTRTRGVLSLSPREVLDGMEHETVSLRQLAEALIELSRAVDDLRAAELDEREQFAAVRAIVATDRWNRAAGPSV